MIMPPPVSEPVVLDNQSRHYMAMEPIASTAVWEPREFYTQAEARGIAITAGPAALQWVVARLSKLPARGDSDTASEYAVAEASRLLSECDHTLPFTVSPTSIEQFENDLLLRWKSQDRVMVLVCPSSENERAQVYRETVVDNKATGVTFIDNATAVDVSASLRWLVVSR
jgi:hypothetical protein